MRTAANVPAGAAIGDATTSWARSCPGLTGELDRDAHAFSIFWREGADLRAKLPRQIGDS
jgi:hypothetical protein